MNIPENLKYTKEHEWIRVEGNEACVGITDYAQSELGEIVFVDIAPDIEGETIYAGDTFGSIEAVKTVSDLYMPVAGTILEINEQLEFSPELVNNDPYGDGWMVRIEVCDLDQLGELLDAKAYAEFINA